MNEKQFLVVIEEIAQRLNRIDVIQEDITEIKITQAKQAKDLEFHILRTTQNEELIKGLKTEMHALWQWKWTLMGGVAVIVFLVTLLVKFI